MQLDVLQLVLQPCPDILHHLLPGSIHGAPSSCCKTLAKISDVVLTAVLLCLSCVAHIAAAQQAPCSSAWTTAALSEARYGLAATSLPNQGLAFFAGDDDGL